MGVRTHPQTGTVPEEVMAEVLSGSRRQEILTTIAEQNGDLPVTDVVRAVCDSDGQESCRAVRRELFDDHLPKLVAAGLLEYESQRDALVLCVGPGRLSDLLDRFGGA